MKPLLAAAAAAMVACAAPASATVVTITETGTIVGDANTYGDGTEFGDIAANLVGQAFSVTYTFDVDPGSVDTDSYGSYFPGSGTASITINGVTQMVTGGPTSFTQRRNEDPAWGLPYGSQFSSAVQGDFGDDFVEDYLTPPSTLSSTDLTAPYYHVATTADYYRYMYAQIGGTHLHGDIETFSANGGAPTPEPASWAMMLAGFGMIGGAMRSVRRKAAIA